MTGHYSFLFRVGEDTYCRWPRFSREYKKMGGIVPDGCRASRETDWPWPYTKTGRPRKAYAELVADEMSTESRTILVLPQDPALYDQFIYVE